jgi:hypothetical protein
MAVNVAVKGPQLAVAFARSGSEDLQDLATLTRMVLGAVADPHKVHTYIPRVPHCLSVLWNRNRNRNRRNRNFLTSGTGTVTW